MVSNKLKDQTEAAFVFKEVLNVIRSNLNEFANFFYETMELKVNPVTNPVSGIILKCCSMPAAVVRLVHNHRVPMIALKLLQCPFWPRGGKPRGSLPAVPSESKRQPSLCL